MSRALATTIDHSSEAALSIHRLKLLMKDTEAVNIYRNLPSHNKCYICTEGRKENNREKNRYNDILPYDETRVKLKSQRLDYINASYVDMNISKSEIINRYICAQGPLANTAAEFWQMIWEQKCLDIVMLTSLVENGVNKCYKYWPDENKQMQFKNLQVHYCSETVEEHYFFRNIILTDSKETRVIHHFQYKKWPDHGVPDDDNGFYNFVKFVGMSRYTPAYPTLVHCSAGVGRTGCFVAIETALDKLRYSEKVDIIAIIKEMRDQRGLLVQNPVQFRFICKTIISAFESNGKSVK
ncbi:Tyrosine-protein phosphatase non-receptor type 3 [Trichoplax sp. H2]|uniref:Protein-tyrosine-phosphatase n=1 Tax=Trichoplax adhaerens TaxID=10228 RepID=B3RQJ9_TRIAD|nr:hypothetical protein TRIADDRAFT_55016 [Trichoplax adhaerens]EDV27258.1 hypothetical protein TRIADDRAFT_55016 [Trichoplax adhaerens]RDD42570.1 Tyrosine-protein phosphatase non-receptor type 3 [Trichoplax sp. H2]|eukprot:XP_002111254.1 hypothetical protein TRIADDRAFT_55016 [Trichoplax adhaerens]